jgi:hypothetical protein
MFGGVAPVAKIRAPVVLDVFTEDAFFGHGRVRPTAPDARPGVPDTTDPTTRAQALGHCRSLAGIRRRTANVFVLGR